MEASPSLSKPVENEEFWKNHHELQKSSRMKRTDYCRKHNLNYDRFGYWINRWNRLKNENSTIGLVSVKIKSNESPSQIKILCTLDLKDGNSLKIHDSEALAVILGWSR
jgi:hypothetical protein